VSSAAPEWTYKDFVDHVRRFDQESVLDAVVAAALKLPRRMDEDPSRYQRTTPWALAAVVKASLCNGNPHRSTPMRARDLILACHMHNNLHPEELDHPHLGSPLAIMVRIGYEQFPYQESMFEELARAEAFFNGYTGSKPLTVITDERLAELLGAPVREAAGVTILLHAGADINGGFFDPSWLDQSNFTPVLNVLPRDTILDVVNTSFATDVTGFKEARRRGAGRAAARQVHVQPARCAPLHPPQGRAADRPGAPVDLPADVTARVVLRRRPQMGNRLRHRLGVPV
jgi:hypothetical protein